MDWYKRFPRKILVGTTGMKAEAYGAYSLLLDHQWERGERRLRSDMAWLAEHARMPLKRFEALWKSHLAEKFSVEGELAWNEVLWEEWQKADAIRLKRKGAANARWKQEQCNGNANALHDSSFASTRASTLSLSSSGSYPKEVETDRDALEEFEAIKRAYPPQRRGPVRIAQEAFADAWPSIVCDGVTLDDMLSNLEAWRGSRDWREGVIPGLTKWLESEGHLVRPEAVEPGDDNAKKTLRAMKARGEL